HRVDAVEERVHLAFRLADDARGHHGRRRLGDGAARPLEGGVHDDAVLHREFEGDPVSAEWVVAFGGPVGGRDLAKVPRLPVVIKDHLRVEVAEIGHQPKISRASSTVAASVSSSARVLYKAIEARAVAGTPNRCITGMAQWCPA